MTSKSKAKLLTALITVLLILLAADAVAIWPAALPWILGAFALPGVWKFSRTLYVWMTTEDEPVKVQLPFGRARNARAPYFKRTPWAWKKEEEA